MQIQRKHIIFLEELAKDHDFSHFWGPKPQLCIINYAKHELYYGQIVHTITYIQYQVNTMHLT